MTAKMNGDAPAMPIHQVWQECGFDGSRGPYFTETTEPGLTKRETMAMHMMAHLMPDDDSDSYEDQAKCAVRAADLLLAELERTK